MSNAFWQINKKVYNLGQKIVDFFTSEQFPFTASERNAYYLQKVNVRVASPVKT